ncbi:zinc ribbon domain-containing protein [candidate division KSB1 bacterium]|nr:zinc ribbon domain-containing protein [candidate division KSB1 bacterium]
MPTYEYVCGECDHHFEEFQRITAEPLETCPQCNGSVTRLISAGNGLIFKGSGFYITDYKNNSGNSAKPKDKSESKSKTEGQSSASSSSSDD